MLLESGNYQLKGLCSWLLRCKKIPQHSANFPVDQVQQSLHFMVVIDVVCQEKPFCSFHICFPVLFCVIKTLYPPDHGHNLLNFTSSPLSCLWFERTRLEECMTAHVQSALAYPLSPSRRIKPMSSLSHLGP